MKIEIVPPQPAEQEIVIRMSKSEAQALEAELFWEVTKSEQPGSHTFNLRKQLAGVLCGR